MTTKDYILKENQKIVNLNLKENQHLELNLNDGILEARF
jgi:hypothetical protein